jgi:hypothetical protein
MQFIKFFICLTLAFLILSVNCKADDIIEFIIRNFKEYEGAKSTKTRLEGKNLMTFF